MDPIVINSNVDPWARAVSLLSLAVAGMSLWLGWWQRAGSLRVSAFWIEAGEGGSGKRITIVIACRPRRGAVRDVSLWMRVAKPDGLGSSRYGSLIRVHQHQLFDLEPGGRRVFRWTESEVTGKAVEALWHQRFGKDVTHEQAMTARVGTVRRGRRYATAQIVATTGDGRAFRSSRIRVDLS